MKWYNLEAFIERSQDLLRLVLKYCDGYDYYEIDNMGVVSLPFKSEHPKNLIKKDAVTASNILKCMNVGHVLDELESNFMYDIQKNIYIFNIWRDKMIKESRRFNVFSEILQTETSEEQLWINLETYGIMYPLFDGKEGFVRGICVIILRLYGELAHRVKDLVKVYKLDVDTKFIFDMMLNNPSVTKKRNKFVTKSTQGSFANIIQYEDREKFLKRLHVLIDGRSGADVGCVILRALQENYIMRLPTRKEFESEFKIIGSWTAIHNYMDNNSDKALDRANRIVFFSE